jgi:chitinase
MKEQGEAATNLAESSESRPLTTFINAGYWLASKTYDGLFPSTAEADSLTQLYYAFADVDGDGSIFLKDEHLHYQIDIDGTNGCLRACTSLKQRNLLLKVLLSVGGGNQSAASRFMDTASSPEKLQRFCDSAKNLIHLFQLDGIDVDWEHPSSEEEGIRYLALLKALRETLPGSLSYIVTTALPADQAILQKLPLEELADSVDQINLMAYDFVGPKYANVDLTGHHAQLFDSAAAGGVSGASTIDYLIYRGVPAGKIILGVPLYTHSFAPATGPRQAFNEAGYHDEIPIRDLTYEDMQETYDADAVAVFAKVKNEFISYDNKVSVIQKARYTRRMRLGGLFFWHLAADRVGDESVVRAGAAALTK